MTVWPRCSPLLVGVGAVGVALVGASFSTHSLPSTIVVVIVAGLVMVPALRRSAEVTERSVRLRRGVVLWSVLVSATLLWEAYAFVRQPDWSRADQDYPTLSTLLDPFLEHGPGRIVGWLVWLGVGWRLVSR